MGWTCSQTASKYFGYIAEEERLGGFLKKLNAHTYLGDSFTGAKDGAVRLADIPTVRRLPPFLVRAMSEAVWSWRGSRSRCACRRCTAISRPVTISSTAAGSSSGSSSRHTSRILFRTCL